MPATPALPVGAPIWQDLSSSDVEKAIAFYSSVFGWTADDTESESGSYVNFLKGDVVIAGLMPNPGGAPDGWTTYLKSDDAQATAAAATQAGATILVEPMDVATLGTMAIAFDPHGAAIGVWQPKEMQGFGLCNEAGAPVWHELQTRDFADEVEFYTKAFGWKTELTGDSDEFRYTVLKSGDTQFAGIMDGSRYLPEGVPPMWEIYIGVDDVDAAVATALAHGGSVVLEPEDTPFGRLAKIADPTGAEIKLSSIPSA
jgi:uncharacterized protein